MNSPNVRDGFQPINKGYNSVFQKHKLSLGLVVPLEAYTTSPIPTMKDHLKRIQLAEELGFSAVWLRDVPFHVPAFGDTGQIYDPFVYLGLLAGQTDTIALGVASIILPLRHPAHIAKAAASVDDLSGGRLLLGIASGDRPEEYPALDIPFHQRGKMFRDSYQYLQQMWKDYPEFQNAYGHLVGHIDMLPKPVNRKIPLLITGSSQQSPEWLAENGDAWMTYPRNVQRQSQLISDWRNRTVMAGLPEKPAMQSLYIDLIDDSDAPPQPIHLGFRSGVRHLREHLKSLEQIGINHVALNLRFNQASIETTLTRISEEILPEFSGA